MLNLIKSIEYWNGTVPKKEVIKIISRSKEATPYLINILKKVLEKPDEFQKDSNYIGVI